MVLRCCGQHQLVAVTSTAVASPYSAYCAACLVHQLLPSTARALHCPPLAGLLCPQRGNLAPAPAPAPAAPATVAARRLRRGAANTLAAGDATAWGLTLPAAAPGSMSSPKS